LLSRAAIVDPNIEFRASGFVRPKPRLDRSALQQRHRQFRIEYRVANQRIRLGEACHSFRSEKMLAEPQRGPHAGPSHAVVSKPPVAPSAEAIERLLAEALARGPPHGRRVLRSLMRLRCLRFRRATPNRMTGRRSDGGEAGVRSRKSG
jgi:hypothetical protein